MLWSWIYGVDLYDMENSLTILDYLYTNIKSPAIHALMSKWAHKFPLEDRYVADEFISLLRGLLEKSPSKR